MSSFPVSHPSNSAAGAGFAPCDTCWPVEEPVHHEMPYSGVLASETIDFLARELREFDLDERATARMLVETGAVIGGGLMANVLAHEFAADPSRVKPLTSHARMSGLALPDIDFFVCGCLSRVPDVPFPAEYYSTGSERAKFLFENPMWAKYEQDLRICQQRKYTVTAAFHKLITPAGYRMTHAPGDDNYKVERTADGDRLFTSTSNIGFSVNIYTRTLMGLEQKLNLVFLDTPIHTAISKVDIGLTAGFLTGSMGGYWMFHHAHPQEIRDLEVKWTQPEATHTPRQRARFDKYCRRYDYAPRLILTPTDFIAQYDDLPEKCDITLTIRESEKTPGLLRRVRGMTEAKIVFVTIPERP